MRNSGKMNHVTLTLALPLILFDAKGLSADLVPCFVARDTNVGLRVHLMSKVPFWARRCSRA
jgi:hypothetical protein